MAFWIALLIALVLEVISYLIMPKPKTSQPSQTKDFEGPTADSSRPVPVVFGTLTLKGPNTLAAIEKSSVKKKVDA